MKGAAMNRCFRRLLLSSVTLLAVTACDPTPHTAPRVVRSMLEQRQEQVVIQQWDISCGAAALATLLTYDLGKPTTEREVAAGMLRHTSIQRVRAQLGFSLLDLKRYAENHGFDADGYGDMTLRDLAETGPAIVPVTLRGYNHFVVFRGIQGDRVLLADPGWGNRTMQIPYFMKVWTTRVAFSVSRPGKKPVHRLMARSDNFWASSTVYETPAKKQQVAQLMDLAPSKSQMIASVAPAPLTETAAGPGEVHTRPLEAVPAVADASTEPTRRAEPARGPVPAKPKATALHTPATAPAPAARPAAPEPVKTAANSAARDTVSILLLRADALMALRDVAAARLLYERAANAGSARAATAAGRTFDPNYLPHLGVVGLPPDRARASHWYREAISLGDTAAEPLLRALNPGSGA
jgi:predicted double-glycine peptidase